MPASLIALLLLAGAVSQAAGIPAPQTSPTGSISTGPKTTGRRRVVLSGLPPRDPGNSKYRLWVGLAIGRRAEGMTGLRRVGAAPLAKQAKQHFERAVELDEENLDALEALQGFHFRGSWADRREQSRGSEDRRPDRSDRPSPGFSSMGRRFTRTRATSTRRQRATCVHASWPRKTQDIWWTMPRISQGGGSTLRATSCSRRPLERDPDDPDACLEAGKAWLQAKRRALYPRAKELLERYLASPARKPNSDPPSHVRKLLKKL